MPNSLDREAFEAWATSEDYSLQRRDTGEYRFVSTANAWLGWQAGAAAEREACAKLCDDIDTHCERYDIDRAFNSSVRRAAKAIRDRSAP